MTTRLLLCLLAGFFAGCQSSNPGAPPVATTEEKIALLAAALEARDRGDLPTARARLEELLRLSPGDDRALRLRDELGRTLAGREASGEPPATAPAPVAPTPAPRPPPALSSSGLLPAFPRQPPLLPPELRLPAPSPPAAGSSGMPDVVEEGALPPPPPDELTRALTRVEAAGAAFAQSPHEVEKLMTYLEAQRALAQLYAERGEPAIAVRTLNLTLATLALYRIDLRSERRQYIQQDVKSRGGIRLRHKKQ